MFVSPPNSYEGALILSVIVFGDGALGGVQFRGDPEGEVLVRGRESNTHSRSAMEKRWQPTSQTEPSPELHHAALLILNFWLLQNSPEL